MARINYAKTSPYYLTRKKDFYLNWYVDRPIRSDSSDVLISVDSKYEHRPDLLAYDLYGDTRYWWVFMRRNMGVIRDPIYGMKAGIEIYVPTKDRLIKILG